MQRFKSPRQAQDFLSAHVFIHDHFYPRRRRMTANDYRAKRMKAFKIWTQETCSKKQHDVAPKGPKPLLFDQNKLM